MTIKIYGLIDPRTEHIRYVGKSKNLPRRMKSHFYDARKGNKCHSRRWIAGLLNAGMEPDICVLEEAQTDCDANEIERFWISYFRFVGADLTNRTPGGDGQPKGYKPSMKTRAKISRSTKGKKASAEARANMKKAFNTPEVREMRRRNHAKLMETNLEWLEKTRRGMTGKKMSAEAKAKISAAWTPERKARHAKKQRQKPVTDKWKAQLATALKARWSKHHAQQDSNLC